MKKVPSSKLTWKMDLLKMYSLFKMGIFHCHVNLVEGNSFQTLQPKQFCRPRRPADVKVEVLVTNAVNGQELCRVSLLPHQSWSNQRRWTMGVQRYFPSGGFLKWWVSPTTMGFPTKNEHFGLFWGYHHLRKHPSRFTISLFHSEIQLGSKREDLS